MSEEGVEEQLKQILGNVFEMEAEEITAESNPENVVLWDSLHHLKMVSAIETVFRVKFTMKEICSMTTFARVNETLMHHLDGNRPGTEEHRQG